MTAVADLPATEAHQTEPAEFYSPAIPLDRVLESPQNPRKHFDKAKLEELAGSIREKGQLTPALVRPHSTKHGYYEIAAGHRRRLALKAAGHATIAAIVRPMDDATFLEVLTVENLQREDVPPLEEAAGYAELLKLPGYDVAVVAAKVGKHETYVYRRLRLLELTPAARKLLESGTISVAAAEVIARVPKEQQKALVEAATNSWRPVTSVSGLKQLVAQNWVALKSAPFKLDDAELVAAAGPCSTCPKRTTNTPQLFGDITTDDGCTDGACYQAKVAALLERRRAELKADDVPFVEISRDWYSKTKGVLTPNQARPCAKNAKGAVRALVVEGDDRGAVTWVTKEREQGEASPAASKYAKEQRDKQDAARRKTDANLAAVVEAVGGEHSFGPLTKAPQLHLIAAGLVDQMSGDAQMRLKKLRKELPWLPLKLADRPKGTKAQALVDAMPSTDVARLVMLLTMLPYVGVSAWYSSGSESLLPSLCNACGVDVAVHQKRVADEHRAKQQAKKAKGKQAKGAKAANKAPAKKRAGDVARAKKAKARKGSA